MPSNFMSYTIARAMDLQLALLDEVPDDGADLDDLLDGVLLGGYKLGWLKIPEITLNNTYYLET